MSAHLGLTVARMHGHLATRPGSDVFHVYSGPLTPSGRFVPLSARTVCHARTRRLSVLQRDSSVLDLGGRRVCGRCSARLTSLGRAERQPVSRDQCLAFYRGITLADLVVAITLAATVDETHRIGFVMSLLFPPAPLRRPAEFSIRQVLFDVNAELLRRRRELRAAGRTPEEVAADQAQRDAEEYDRALVARARAKDARIDRAIDRRNRGGYMTRAERELVDTA